MRRKFVKYLIDIHFMLLGLLELDNNPTEKTHSSNNLEFMKTEIKLL